ncbi:hypothetical protein BaOVIS_032250 [Babesia ovis]|uniref:Uncharacterized protein n=1 Tax=Babesia ovis TaxID=5869 RepID=A0A9W5TE16_BABOV|nr:hypothetical protein BaOVIS_032250 [Babesia ovis]
MDETPIKEEVETCQDVSPSTSTRSNRIQNMDLHKSDSDGDDTEVVLPTNTEDEELPEGWVRHGTGLMLDVPITPRMRGRKRSPNQAHFVFTQQNDSKATKHLRTTLLEIDRNAMRMMRQEQGVRIRATKPANEPQESVYRQHTPATQPNTRCTRWMRSRVTTPTAASSGAQDEAVNRKIALLKRQHEREIMAAKQQVLEQVDALVKKYRQLAIDAVKVARDEQRKAEQERRNAYDVCVRYEADLMANVRNAIAQLKLSSKVEQDRVAAERDALQRRCADLTPSSKINKTGLDMITAKIIAQFQDNQKFNMDVIDNTIEMILNEYSMFQTTAVDLMVEKFAALGCELSREDATVFVENTITANAPEL